MAFGAEPAEICPQTTDTPLRTSTRRESTAGTLTAICARAKTSSSVRCGREVWPPRPESSILMVSEAEVIAPIRVPILPTSIRGSQCSARMRGTPSRTPCSMHEVAPPGIVSSAGWKMIRTVQRSGDGPLSDVDRQAGSLETPGLEPGFLEPLRELVGSAEFLERQLGVRME